MPQEKIPDIVGKPITRKLSRIELEERIGGFFCRHSLCLLAIALFGFSGQLPSQCLGSVIRIEPMKIEMLDIALKQDGYGARQVG